MIYIITVPGEPVGKQRPQFSSVSRSAFTPPKTREYEEFVKFNFLKKYKNPMLEGPIRLRVTAYMQIAKSQTKKAKEAMSRNADRPLKTPDLDNIIKCISDALNGTAYVDDAQVVEVSASKYWSFEPRVEIEIERLENANN